MTKKYDFIIVGGGSSGCVLASTLIQNNYSVLLLERGKRQEAYPATFKANDWGKAFVTKALKTLCSEPMKGLNQIRTLIAVGDVLGGGSSINSMMYFRTPRDLWQDLQAYPEWSFERLERLQDEIESILLPSRPPKTEFSSAFVDAAKEAGFTFNEDFDKKGYSGVGYNLTSSHAGKRRSAYTAFMQPHLENKNLTIQTNALVTRILLNDKQSAIGIEYTIDGKSQKAWIQASGEIILSAGALETPKILMLSGIGPKAELEKLNIPCRVDHPSVGQHLLDQPDCPITYRSKKPLSKEVNQIQACVFAQSSVSEEPDLQILCFPGNYSIEMFLMGLRGMPNWVIKNAWSRALFRGLFRMVFSLFPPLKTLLRNTYILMPCLMRPRNRGQILLRSTNPKDDPIIDLDYLSDPKDVKALLEGLEMTRKIGDSRKLDSWRQSELMPGKNATLKKHLQKNTGTTYHYAGTCRIGSVVDPQLKVKGVGALRIADSSILSRYPVVTPNGTCLLIGRNAAQMILEEE